MIETSSDFYHFVEVCRSVTEKIIRGRGRKGGGNREGEREEKKGSESEGRRERGRELRIEGWAEISETCHNIVWS